MTWKSMFFVAVVVLLGVVGNAGAAVYLPCDVGDCSGRIQPGWINIPGCGEYTDIGDTDVDVGVYVQRIGDGCTCRGYFDEFSGCPAGLCPAVGPLGDVEQDFVMGDDLNGPGEADVIIVFKDLVPNYEYRLTSYHNRLDEGTCYIGGVQVSGATNVQAPGQIAQAHSVMDNPPVTTFTPTGTEVIVRFIAPEEGGGDKPHRSAQAFLNGFILEGGPNDVNFDSKESGDSEAVTEVVLNVLMAEPSGETVTVDYAVTGGTATPGDDFVLEPGTLTFEAGETAKTIIIQVVDDGIDEPDETIVVTLSDLVGTDIVLGSKFEHTYTILDPKPFVQFDLDSSMGTEDEGILPLLVTLTDEWTEDVTVDYAVTGGTATADVDFVLEAGTLTFSPGQKSGTVDIDLINDGAKEDPETVVVTLSNPTNAKLAEPVEHTATIRDPWPTQYEEMFRVDLGCPGNAASFKEGWIPWEVNQGCDGEAHDGRSISNIGGTGIGAYVGVYNDSGGNMFTREGDAIANSAYFLLVDGRGHPTASMRIRLSGLEAGAYSLQAYHSWGDFSNIKSVTTEGEGVIEIQIAINVPIQPTTVDDELNPSEARFYTDGTGTVSIIYEAAATSKACVNAFILSAGVEGPAVCPCPGDLNSDGQVDLEDLQAVAQVLLTAGSPFVVSVPPAPLCAELTGDSQVDLDDLQAVAGLLLNAGSPFVVSCQ